MQEQRLTFFQKRPTECPVCQAKFYREDLLSGGGRLIAGALTDELRRLYEPSKKYGEVRPLIYPVSVCPSCLFAAFPPDFGRPAEHSIKTLELHADERRDSLALVLSGVDFSGPRGLKEGIASYYLALASYAFMDRHANPTFKAGLCALRAAWLLTDLDAVEDGEGWDELALSFYQSARAFYLATLDREQHAQEPLAPTLQLGPDMDKNYGYDGVIYLTGFLDWKYGEAGDRQARAASLERARRIIAKVFGMGRKTKDKPTAILDKAKDVYERIGGEIDQLKGASAPAARRAAP